MSKGDITDCHTDRNGNNPFRRRSPRQFTICDNFANRCIDMRQTAGEFRVGLTILRQTIFTELIKVLSQRDIVNNKLRSTV